MSVYGRAFAWGYDRFQAGMEREFFGQIRREMLAGASGRVVEIGSGTGANLEHYPRTIEELVCTEPEEPMARRLREKAAGSGLPVRVIEAPAERLPFDDGSFDTAVAALVLCTVTDPDAALAEIARVLKPGGRFVFMEHVRAEDPGLAKWQDRLHPLWLRFGHGCNCNRPTLENIEASSLRLETFRRGRIPKAPPIVRPLVTGVAASPD
ncbi:MAG TPA: class I SAM-dependent methyltransferase [Thermoleophilaceae bacterium]